MKYQQILCLALAYFAVVSAAEDSLEIPVDEVLEPVAGVEALEEVNICEGVADFIFLTDVTNCSKYYICVKGVAVSQICDRNLNFNAAQQSCVESAAHCLKCDKNALSQHALERTCNKYVLCYSGKPLIRSCADNLQFNKNIKKCDLAENVDCVENKCALEPSSEPTYARSPSNCGVYFICMNGKQYREECAPGLQFNTESNECDHAETVKCKVNAPQAPVSKRLLTNLLEVQPKRATDILCPEKGILYIKHKLANKYYVCADGKGSVLTCAAGLVFDEAKKECRLSQQIEN